MAKKNMLWGIRIVPEIDVPVKENPISASYEFEIARGSFADSLFFTSPALRQVIETNPSLKKFGTIGGIGYAFVSQKKVQQHYWPFGESKTIEKVLKRKGIASELEKRVLIHLKSKVGDLIIEPSFGLTSKERNQQLARRNIKHDSDFIPSHQTKLSRVLASINMVKRRRKRIFQQLRRH